MSGGGGIIIVSGRNGAGQDQSSPPQCTPSDVQAAIDYLANAPSNNLGAKHVHDALQSALTFANS